MKIAFIGAGKMAEALLSGLPAGEVIASDVSEERLTRLKKKHKVLVTRDNSCAFEFGDIVVLAVKPQQMKEVLSGIKAQGKSKRSQKLVVSIAAGITLKFLQKYLPGFPIVRVMPNNPCMVGAGMTALAKNKQVNRKQYLQAEKIFKTVGEVVEVPEKLMDAVTGLSGSGPAFVYLAIEALEEGGVMAGLPRKLAKTLALQTVAGAVETVKKSGHEPAALREMVTSPGGTTMEGLAVLEKRVFKRALGEAVVAATKKAKKLSAGEE